MYKNLKRIIFQFIIISSYISSLIFSQNNSIKNEEEFSSNLPIIIINRNGKAIISSKKTMVDMKIIYNGEGKRNFLTDTNYVFNEKVGIELRGSSSQMFPKKQYGFETWDSLQKAIDVSILGLPKENDWVLSASYNDKTFIRDVITFKLMNDMGHYASRYKYCELFLEDSYQGIYILFEKIKRNKNRINISKMTSTDISGDSLTGGYIIKNDKWDGEVNGGWQSEYSPVNSPKRISYQYHYPKPDEITNEQQTYIKNFIRSFENIMASSQYSDSINGYIKYIDLDSFIDMCIINELAKNVDGYRLSTFLYKDRDSKDTKLYVGPVWDFNLAFGNADYFDGWIKSGWALEYLTTNKIFLDIDPSQVPFWWTKLFYNNNFRNIFYKRWEELRETVFNLSYINNFIDSLASFLNEAQQRNFDKWKILGIYVWPNPIDEWKLATYTEQITYLKNWIRDRIGWIDWIISITDISNNNLSHSGYLLYQNYPNPFNPSTKIKYSIPTTSPLLPLLCKERAGVSWVTLKVYDILGNEVATLVNEEKTAGNYEIKFDASEKSSGMYFYTLKAGNWKQSRKMIILK
jgi:hypothetical protein